MCSNILKGYIEVPVFLLFFCFMFSGAVTANFIVYRICYVTMGYNEPDCALLGTNNVSEEINNLEKKVQPGASILFMIQIIIASIVPAILSLFIGPWIDKHGRRPIILYVLAGNFVTYLVLVAICLSPGASPWWWLLTALTTSIGGGETSLLMACVCYITDTTSESNRGLRMGIFEASMSIGTLIGITLSAYIFNIFGYTFIYSICALCSLIAMMYTYFCIPESIANKEKEESKKLFQVSLVKNMYKTCKKKRPDNNTIILWLLMIILTLFLLADHADKQVFFLFLREKFLWSLEKYTIYSSVCIIIGITTTLVIIYTCQKLLKTNEIILTLIAFFATFTTSLLYGLANDDIGIYLAGLFKSTGGIVRPMIKSAISKIVAPDELGQVLTITSSAESITPLITSPIYTYVYNKTLYVFPSTFNFITGALHGINIILISTLMWKKRKPSNEERTEEKLPEQNNLI